jgi:hypothetical protein
MSEKRQKSSRPAILFREKNVHKTGYIDDYIFAAEIKGEDHMIWSKPRKPKYHLVIIVIEGYLNMVINGEKFRFGKRTYVNLPTWSDIYEIEYGGGFHKEKYLPTQNYTKELIRYIAYNRPDVKFIILRAENKWKELLDADVWYTMQPNTIIAKYPIQQRFNKSNLGEKEFEELMDIIIK